ncbi:hypothetical protein FUAX_43360 (plasmid) [Fulvitalea axinellae]|uniref:Tetratricopeptide repeat protein n=1 Tax=Fulvitalea axinellae TaxID=1182444 RepID=A0AAU9CZG2_9BACT|nr:hypothetical protein FUAX_43360 [Fulvitalea axinellae]
MRNFLFVVFIFLAPMVLKGQDNSSKQDLQSELAKLDSILLKDNLRAKVYYKKFHYLFSLGKFKEAGMTLRKAINLMPDSVILYVGQAEALSSVGGFRESAKVLTVAYEKAVTDSVRSEILTMRGGNKANFMDYDGAYSDLVYACRIDPKNLNAKSNLAAVCDEVGRPDEAWKHLKELVKNNPEYFPGYLNLGFKYQKHDMHKEAIECFDKALRISPKQPLAFSNRSFSKLEIGDLKGAMEDIETSISIYPTNSYAHMIKAKIFLKKKKKRKACEALDAAEKLGFKDRYGDEVEKLKGEYCEKYLQ